MALFLKVGDESGTESVLQFAKYFKPDTLSCTPSLAEYLIEKAPETIGVDVKDLGFKRLFCAGEPGAGVPEMASGFFHGQTASSWKNSLLCIAHNGRKGLPIHDEHP